MKYETIVGPSTEPVTIAEVKAQLRLDSDDDDALLAILTATARENFEAQTGRLLLSRTVRVMWDGWPFYSGASMAYTPYISGLSMMPIYAPTLRLPLYPAREVASFATLDDAGDPETVAASTRLRYIDDAGALQTVSTSDYRVDYTGKTPRIVLNPDVDIPSFGNYANSVQAEYVCGAESAADVPADAKQAMLLLITMLYERREDMKIKGGYNEVRAYDFLQFNHRTNLV